MVISKYQSKKVAKLKQRAFMLYKQGLTLRDVGKIVERSRTWVLDSVRELEKEEANRTKLDTDNTI